MSEPGETSAPRRFGALASVTQGMPVVTASDPWAAGADPPRMGSQTSDEVRHLVNSASSSGALVPAGTSSEPSVEGESGSQPPSCSGVGASEEAQVPSHACMPPQSRFGYVQRFLTPFLQRERMDRGDSCKPLEAREDRASTSDVADIVVAKGPIAQSLSASSDSSPSCLICLDAITDEQMESGEAIRLECLCNGTAALRHRSCIDKWIQTKGDNICDICKSEIRNIDPPATGTGSPGAGESGGAQFHVEVDPGSEVLMAEQMRLDCMRWMVVGMVVGIFVFQFNVVHALFLSMLMGVVYVAVFRYMLHGIGSRRAWTVLTIRRPSRWPTEAEAAEASEGQQQEAGRAAEV